MDVIHRYGILFIQFMQLRCKSWSQLMIWVSNLSNPAWSYVVYFPLVYYLHRSVGRRVLWVAALSEWINAVLKWILHGERPYWWAHEAGMCEGRIKPCNQFYITCETGPGSPSGHCMVTVSVFYVMVSALLYHVFSQSRHRRAAALSLWSLFAVVTCLINLSRCFIFAHFPHQVITGSIIALLMAMYFNLLSTTSMGLRHYVGVAGGMLVGASGVYLSLSYLGFDPHWSVSKAQRWCAHHSWVYLQTTLFFAVVKASSSLLGLGFAEYMNSLQQSAQDTNKEPGCSVETFSMISWLSSFVMALMFAFGIEKIKISQEPVVIFYVISYIKYVLVIFVISAVIPRIVEFSVSLLHTKCKKE